MGDFSLVEILIAKLPIYLMLGTFVRRPTRANINLAVDVPVDQCIYTREEGFKYELIPYELESISTTYFDIMMLYIMLHRSN